jgi:hypothetical protein
LKKSNASKNKHKSMRRSRKPKTDRVPRTRAGGEWTEAAFWGFLRSGLRGLSRRWPPIVRLAAKRVRRAYSGPNRRQKWEYLCADCGGWYPGKQVAVDHVVPAGSLKGWDDLAGFCERLFCEVDGLRVLCHECHQRRTNEARTLTSGGGE